MRLCSIGGDGWSNQQEFSEFSKPFVFNSIASDTFSPIWEPLRYHLKNLKLFQAMHKPKPKFCRDIENYTPLAEIIANQKNCSNIDWNEINGTECKNCSDNQSNINRINETECKNCSGINWNEANGMNRTEFKECSGEETMELNEATLIRASLEFDLVFIVGKTLADFCADAEPGNCEEKLQNLTGDSFYKMMKENEINLPDYNFKFIENSGAPMYSYYQYQSNNGNYVWMPVGKFINNTIVLDAENLNDYVGPSDCSEVI